MVGRIDRKGRVPAALVERERLMPSKSIFDTYPSVGDTLAAVQRLRSVLHLSGTTTDSVMCASYGSHYPVSSGYEDWV